MVKPKLLTTLQDYTAKLFVSDAFAGLTVAMVALPLSIAIAIASGATPAAGLVTAIVGGFLISALGGSRVQIGGPTGAFIVVVYGVIEQFGFDGLLLATLMAGVILVIAAYARAGNLIALIPEAVIEGFTIGIALIIAISQLKDLLRPIHRKAARRFPVDRASPVERKALSESGGRRDRRSIDHRDRAVAKARGSIVVMALASAAVALLILPVETIHSRFGNLPDGLPYPLAPRHQPCADDRTSALRLGDRIPGRS